MWAGYQGMTQKPSPSTDTVLGVGHGLGRAMDPRTALLLLLHGYRRKGDGISRTLHGGEIYLLRTRISVTLARPIGHGLAAPSPGALADAERLPGPALAQGHLARLLRLVLSPAGGALPGLGLAALRHVLVGHAERADGGDVQGGALLLGQPQPPPQGRGLELDRVIEDGARERLGPLVRKVRHPLGCPGD